MNDAGELVDEHTKENIRELLDALLDWTMHLRDQPAARSEEGAGEYESYHRRGEASPS